MKSKTSRFFARNFNQFINNTFLFEDSNLNKIGLPQEMVKAIHTKSEHWTDENPLMGKMYIKKGGVPRDRVMPHQYFQPPHDIEIPDPILLTNHRTLKTPFLSSDEIDDIRYHHDNNWAKTLYNTRGSADTDLAWYLKGIEPGKAHRILITHPESELFLFIYYKRHGTTNIKSTKDLSPRQRRSRLHGKTAYEKPERRPTTKHVSGSGPGHQLGIIVWDKAIQKTRNLGFSELGTWASDRGLIRKVHEDKGGNTVGKTMELITRSAKSAGGKISRTNPIVVYELPIDYTGKKEVRSKVRKSRKESGYIGTRGKYQGKQQTSLPLLIHAATVLEKIISGAGSPKNSEKLKSRTRNKVNIATPENLKPSIEIPIEIERLSELLETTKEKVFLYLFKMMRDFRQGLYNSSRFGKHDEASEYDMTQGSKLEEENLYLGYNMYKGAWNKYAYETDYKTKYTTGQVSLGSAEFIKRGESDDEFIKDDELDPREYKDYMKWEIPMHGHYAGIASMVELHTLDGITNMFLSYIYTGKLRGYIENVDAFSGTGASLVTQDEINKDLSDLTDSFDDDELDDWDWG
jgi:hypothetical protein